jgi:hypothetical protein
MDISSSKLMWVFIILEKFAKSCLTGGAEHIPFDKLIVLQLLKKFPALFVTRRFTTVSHHPDTGSCPESD